MSLVSPGVGGCLSVRLQLMFLSLLSLLPLTRRPLRASLAPPTHTRPPSSPLDCSSLPPSLPSFLPPPPRLVHGGKGTRFTLSEDIYPEKGTCLRRPPAPGARCLRPSWPRLVKGPSFCLHGLPGPSKPGPLPLRGPRWMRGKDGLLVPRGEGEAIRVASVSP